MNIVIIGGSVVGLGAARLTSDQARIFEEFYRAPSADASERRGSGLGLAIVRRLCHVMQTTITVSSAPGSGTCFHLIFPRTLRCEKSSGQD